MATAKKAAAKKAPAKKAPARKAPAGKGAPAKKAAGRSAAPGDALQLLKSDHEEVEQLFDQYSELVDSDAGDDEKQQLAEQICKMLTVHATIEEEVFYPAAREALDEQDLLDEAEVEHASAKDLIAQIQGMDPSEELYDAKVTVLGEYVSHHVEEEESEMFPKVKKSSLDLKAIGQELLSRKQALMGASGKDVAP